MLACWRFHESGAAIEAPNRIAHITRISKSGGGGTPNVRKESYTAKDLTGLLLEASFAVELNPTQES